MELLSQMGTGALQLPEGRQVSSGAPISEFPLAQESSTRVFILVLVELRISPRRLGTVGQCTAKTTHF